jgi:nitrogen fixation protein FixH
MTRNRGWRWFPAWLIGSMALTFGVNAYLVYTAVSSFPGEAGRDGFDLGNDYARVLKVATAQAALGWQVETTVDQARHPLLRVTDRTGRPLGTAAMDVQAERPVGPAGTTALRFSPGQDGSFKADTDLDRGQWDLLVTVRADGQVYTTTRRLVVD